MPVPNRMSVVLPVRDAEDRITGRIEKVLDVLESLTDTPDATEIIVVDDGSSDDTATIVQRLESQHAPLRLVRHDRPRGMEAAGQTGLERSTGDLIFIQESDSDIRADDMLRLHKMSRDHSIVAARAESRPRRPASELIRRLKAWGTRSDTTLIDQPAIPDSPASIQMIRRHQLQRLASPQNGNLRLSSDTSHTTSVQ